MILETERLILRPWEERDANDLFQYASHPEVGPIAGWPVHTSVENSREIIKSYFSAPEIYAIVLKETMQPVGSIGLMIGSASDKGIPDTEAEIGYWIGVWLNSLAVLKALSCAKFSTTSQFQKVDKFL